MAQPLLPMRVVLDRTRAGSYLAVATVGAGMFGVFLFLTYYLQQTLGFSPVETGLAFLPMVVAIVISAQHRPPAWCRATGPRPIVPVGMLLAMVGMISFTGIGVHSDYATAILPGLIVMGLGMGSVMAPVDVERDRGRRQPRRGRRLGAGQHRPAGRRLDRHGLPEHASPPPRRPRSRSTPAPPRARP